jgi:hypothetical protein
MGEMGNAYKILMGKLEGKVPLGRHRRRWKDNIGMDLTVTMWEGVAECICFRIGTSGGLW